MNILHKILIVSAVAVLPWQALAADSPAKAAPAAKAAADKPAGIWKRMDTNGDGVISKDEWMADAAARFKEIDTNGDGKITHEEMKAYGEKMKARSAALKAQHDAEKKSQ